jgi:hypothetical protein
MSNLRHYSLTDANAESLLEKYLTNGVFTVDITISAYATWPELGQPVAIHTHSEESIPRLLVWIRTVEHLPNAASGPKMAKLRLTMGKRLTIPKAVTPPPKTTTAA